MTNFLVSFFIFLFSGISGVHAEPAANEVPVAATNFVGSGAATIEAITNGININQQSNSASLNWESFNIGREATVNFRQPDASSVALNNILQNSPSQIFGALNANGQIYLINQNGIIFGKGSQVNVGGLIASTLDPVDDLLENGLLDPAGDGLPAFMQEEGEISQAIEVEAGAKIAADAEGRIFLFAPDVINKGEISTPDGQTVLAAGQKIYLAASNDSNIRGLLVEVDVGGTVSNAIEDDPALQEQATDPNELVGKIFADRGNVTLVGLAVNQEGLISANTAVQSNGTIRLLARDTVSFDGNGDQLIDNSRDEFTFTTQRSGEVKLGENSITQTLPDLTDNSVSVDQATQPKGRVDIYGELIELMGGSKVTAPSGTVNIISQAESDELFVNEQVQGAERIQIHSGAEIDVAGLEITRSVSDNVLSADLRSNELADSFLQQGGNLDGVEVSFDIRQRGTREDGTEWEGTPLADLSGFIDSIERTIDERHLEGGTVNILSQGAVVIEPDATIDVSGGAINFESGVVRTTQLLTQNSNQSVDIADADPNVLYQGVLDPSLTPSSSFFEQGYVEGKDAGALIINAKQAFISDQANLLGEAKVGRLQQSFDRSNPSANPLRLYRPHNEVPLGGRFQLGDEDGAGATTVSIPNFALGGIQLTNNAISVPLINELIDVDNDVAQLSESIFSQGGFTRIGLNANRTISLDENVNLTLSPGSSFDLGASRIDIQGNVISPSGEISLTSVLTDESRLDTNLQANAGVFLASTGELNTSGKWINESSNFLPTNDNQRAVQAIDGGTISIAAENSGRVELASGSLVDVSAGAAYLATGSGNQLKVGKAGEVALSLSGEVPEPAILEGTILGYGINNNSGGGLSIEYSQDICITNNTCSLGASAQIITPSLLEQGGFTDITVNSVRGRLSVEENTQLNLLGDTRFLAPTGLTGGAELFPTGTSISNITSIVGRDPLFTDAVDVSLQSTLNLFVNEGALIQTLPQGSIHLFSDYGLFVDGTLRSRSGRISLELGDSSRRSAATGLLDENGLNVSSPDLFLPQSAIWLGQNASLSTKGAAITNEIIQNGVSLTQGSVFDGGEILLEAKRGSIVTEQGSIIDASGSTAQVDFISTNPFSPQLITTTLFSGGGNVSLTAAEGMALDGAIDLSAPAGSNENGGALSIVLDSSNRGAGDIPTFNQEARKVVITGSSENTLNNGLAFGDAIPDQISDQAVIKTNLVNNSGAADLYVASQNHLRIPISGGQDLREGIILLENNPQLTLGRNLQLESIILEASGSTQAEFRANSIQLGSRFSAINGTNSAEDQRNANSGAGEVSFIANNIDLSGNLIADGFANFSLQSSGDIRLSGVQRNGSNQITGFLNLADSDLNLTSQQLYPTTFSNFTLNVTGENGRIVTNQFGGVAGDVLSVGGALTLTANSIEHNGTISAPLGSIEFSATNQLTLGAESVTSTSLNEQLLPFGQVQFGTDWVYELPSGLNVLFGENGIAFPEKQVRFAADDINIMSGSTIDVSGGGDVYAYEFIPGIDGSRDILSAENSPNSYAIVPNLNLDFAPIDPQETTNTNIAFGEQIEILQSANGLAAGTYTKLPARYALLPGAILVTDVGEASLEGQPVQNLDSGRIIVSARTTFANTNIQSENLRRVEIETREQVLQRARYDIFKANELFADASINSLPEDSGTVSILANNSLNLAGDLISSSVNGGRGAILNIASQNIGVSPNLGANSFDESFLVLTADQLNGFGAESLLLGGERDITSEGTELNIISNEVVIEENVGLSIPELLLAANEKVTIGASTTIDSGMSGADQLQTLEIANNAAIVGVSSISQIDVQRSLPASGANADIELQPGVSLIGEDSVIVDAPGVIDFAAQTIAAVNGAIDINSPNINFGLFPENAVGLNLSTLQLQNFSGNALNLTSTSTLNFYGDVSLSFNEINLDAPGITGFIPENSVDQPDVNIASQTSLRLSNSSGTANAANSIATGSLTLTAGTLVLDDGAFQFSGFADSNLVASETILVGNGEINTIGNLTVDTGSLTSTIQGDYALIADGAIAIQNSETDRAEAVLQEQALVGGRLLVDSQSNVTIDTNLNFRSGDIEIQSVGDTTIQSEANIDLSGVSVEFGNGEVVRTNGGGLAITSSTSNVSFLENSSVNVQGAEGLVNAGSIDIVASQGVLQFAGNVVGAPVDITQFGNTLTNSEYMGASFAVDVASIESEDFTALNTKLNTSGFTGDREIRVRTGDLTVTENSPIGSADTFEIVANNTRLIADTGNILIDGDINADAKRGGRVGLYAGNNLSIASTANFTARGLSEGFDGGEIELSAATGTVDVATGSSIDVSTVDSSADGGIVRVRALRNASDNDVLVSQFDPTISGQSKVEIEAVRVYDRTSETVVDNAFRDQLLIDTQNFAANLGAISTRLGLDQYAESRVLPGIEIQSQNDLSINTELNFASLDVSDQLEWRFGADQVPGILTLRAAGNIEITELGDIRDGIENNQTDNLGNEIPGDVIAGDSWSFRVTAGNDLTSASAESLLALNEDATTGNLIIAPGEAGTPPMPGGFGPPIPGTPATYRGLRTGNGFIYANAANDITYGNAQSVTITYGVPDNEGFLPGSLSTLQYLVDGGDIRLNAGRDIKGFHSDQLVTDWLWKTGGDRVSIFDPTRNSIAWAPNVDEFQQNVAALAGNDIYVNSGRNIIDLSLSAPTIGKQIGGLTIDESNVQVINSGNIFVEAGGDILGGNYFTGNGDLEIVSEGSLAASDTTNLFPILAAADTSINVNAQSDIGIETIYNPTFLPTSDSQQAVDNSYFFTYALDASATIQSNFGDVQLLNSSDRIRDQHVENFALQGENLTVSVYTPQLDVLSPFGGINIEGAGLILHPSPIGNLALLAGNDISIGQTSRILQSDADPRLFDLNNPLNQLNSTTSVTTDFDITDIFTTSTTGNIVDNNDIPFRHSEIPQHLQEFEGRVDTRDSSVIAKNGSIIFQGRASVLETAEPVNVRAGKDIILPTIVAQNNRASDVTTVSAGGSLLYPVTRDSRNEVQVQGNQGIFIDGPGDLLITTGGDIDLGASSGIVTRGNLINTNLADEGANVSLFTSLPELTDETFTDFIVEYILDPDNEHDYDLDTVIFSALLGRDANTLLADRISDANLLSEFENEVQIGNLPATFQGLSAEQLQFLFQLGESSDAIVALGDEATSESVLNILNDNPYLAGSEFDSISLIAESSFVNLAPKKQASLIQDIFYAEVRESGRIFNETGDQSFADAALAINLLFPNRDNNPADVSLVFSRVITEDGGDIDVFVPNGTLQVGVATPTEAFGVDKEPDELGLITRTSGNIAAYSRGNIDVNESRIVTAGGNGRVTLFSEEGDIDAGRGAKTAISAPTDRVFVDAFGNVIRVLTQAIQGAGIQALGEGGDVELFTPRGRVIAGDAGIVSGGNLTIAAVEVVGTDNIDVGGAATGVDLGGSAASFVVPDAGTAATSQTEDSVSEDEEQNTEDNAGNQALAFLDVFVMGFGDDLASPKPEVPAVDVNESDIQNQELGVDNCLQNETNEESRKNCQ